MTKENAIKLFQDRKVRVEWDDKQEKWYFSVVDVVTVLTDNAYQGARNYWKVLKNRLKKEGSETVTNCNQLKMLAPDGGTIAGNTRKEIEEKTGKSVISKSNAKELMSKTADKKIDGRQETEDGSRKRGNNKLILKYKIR